MLFLVKLSEEVINNIVKVSSFIFGGDKSTFLGLYQGIKDKFFQFYLEEFCKVL